LNAWQFSQWFGSFGGSGPVRIYIALGARTYGQFFLCHVSMYLVFGSCNIVHASVPIQARVSETSVEKGHFNKFWLVVWNIFYFP
jgi:hypothetical protein